MLLGSERGFGGHEYARCHRRLRRPHRRRVVLDARDQRACAIVNDASGIDDFRVLRLIHTRGVFVVRELTETCRAAIECRVIHVVLPFALSVRCESGLSNQWANCRRAGDPALISWRLRILLQAAYTRAHSGRRGSVLTCPVCSRFPESP